MTAADLLVGAAAAVVGGVVFWLLHWAANIVRHLLVSVFRALWRCREVRS